MILQQIECISKLTYPVKGRRFRYALNLSVKAQILLEMDFCKRLPSIFGRGGLAYKGFLRKICAFDFLVCIFA